MRITKAKVRKEIADMIMKNTTSGSNMYSQWLWLMKYHGRMSDREQMIYILDMLGNTLLDTAKEFGVTKERIRQIKEKARRKLHVRVKFFIDKKYRLQGEPAELLVGFEQEQNMIVPNYWHKKFLFDHQEELKKWSEELQKEINDSNEKFGMAARVKVGIDPKIYVRLLTDEEKQTIEEKILP